MATQKELPADHTDYANEKVVRSQHVDNLPKSDAEGELRLDVRLQNETVWLSIKQMAELFHVDKSGISRHLKNAFESGELLREASVAKFATVQNEGAREVTREVFARSLRLFGS